MMSEMSTAKSIVPGLSHDGSIGRIVSVTGSKAIVLLDNQQNGQ